MPFLQINFLDYEFYEKFKFLRNCENNYKHFQNYSKYWKSLVFNYSKHL